MNCGDIATARRPRPRDRARAMSATHGACARAHDAANVPVLTLIALACVAGIAGALDPLVVTKGFLAYIVLDGLWIALWPRCVPSAAAVVVAHHVVTAALLAYPLRHPERAIETCRNGLVEANTLFLILRRRVRRGSAMHAVWNGLYVATLAPVRFAWQPYLLWHFYANVTKDDVWWEKVQVCGAQMFLIGFNVFLVARRRVAPAKKEA